VFAALGCVVQAGAISVAAPLPTWVVVPGAAIAALPMARGLTRRLGRWFPRAETYVQTGGDLIGRVGEVTVGPVIAGRVARARILDQYGNVHFPRVAPAAPDAEIAAGRQIMVVAVKGGVLEVVEVP
jgi:membrane protein implicated in regulation of membrane protease activity